LTENILEQIRGKHPKIYAGIKNVETRFSTRWIIIPNINNKGYCRTKFKTFSQEEDKKF
jgi:hypothetical protein